MSFIGAVAEFDSSEKKGGSPQMVVGVTFDNAVGNNNGTYRGKKYQVHRLP